MPTKKYDLEYLKTFIKKTMHDWLVPGLAIVVVKDGSVLLSEGFGFRDVKKRLKVTPQTIFTIASCTKAFTTLSLAMLVEQKKLDWDKPVRYYMPQFTLYDEAASNRITARDLVCHRTGLPRYDWVWYRSKRSRKDIVESLKFLKPNKDFRTFYQYQNIMFMAAGLLLEHITGSLWEDFVAERIFSPLGMNLSNFSVEDSQKSSNFAKPYMKKGSKIKEIDFLNVDACGPAGSINSTVDDLGKWLMLHLGKGKFAGKQIIPEECFNEIHKPQMVISDAPSFKEIINPCYALGWTIVSYCGKKMLRHGGSLDGFSSCVSFMPEENLGIAILTNMESTDAHNVILYTVYDRLLGIEALPWNKRFKELNDKDKKTAIADKKKEKTKKIKGTKPSRSISEFVGEYVHPAYGAIKIEKDKDNLFLLFNNIRFPMTHFHYDVFEFTDPVWGTIRKVNFFSNMDGRLNKLYIRFEVNADEIEFVKK